MYIDDASKYQRRNEYKFSMFSRTLKRKSSAKCVKKNIAESTYYKSA